MLYIIKPVDGTDIVIYVCSKQTAEKMMDEISSIDLSYIVSDENEGIQASKDDPFLLSLISDN